MANDTMEQAAAHHKPPRASFYGWIILVLSMAAAFLPAEMLRIGGRYFRLALYFQQSFWLVAGVVVLLFMIQGMVWLLKKRWVKWPTALAGLHLAAFAAIRMINLWQLNKAWNEKASNPMADQASAGIGLYLLLFLGLALLTTQALGLVKKKEPDNKG
jgi:hypothetical protein